MPDTGPCGCRPPAAVLPRMSTSTQLSPRPTLAPASSSLMDLPAIPDARASRHSFTRMWAAGDGRPPRDRCRFRCVGQHLVSRARKPLDALDHDPVRARTLDLPPPVAIKKIREVDHLGLARRVLEDGLAEASVAAIIRFSVPVTVTVSSTSRAPFEPLGARLDVAVFDVDCRAHGLQARNMDVDRARTDPRSRPAGTRPRSRSAPAGAPAPGSRTRMVLTSDRARNGSLIVDASTSMRIFSSMVTETPSPEELDHGGHVLQMRHVRTRHRAVRQEASPPGSGGPRVAFLAPDMRISPSSGMPP